MLPPLWHVYDERIGTAQRLQMRLMDQMHRSETEASQRRNLNPAAQRALAEAQERRRRAAEDHRPPEIGGRKGPDPVRYGDWEVKGIASDF